MPLKIAGITKMSTSDWPKKISMVVFLQGCPWNCEYCHNPDMIPFDVPSNYSFNDDVLEFLKKRFGLLDGVVFSGGEATAQNLKPYIEQIKKLGFKVGLHTNGTNPINLKKILPLIDWVGFDFKALPKDIDKITRTTGASEKALKSFEILLNSGVDYEIRTTYGPGVFDKKYALKITSFLKEKGVKRHILQNVRPDGTRDEFVKKYYKALKN
jgi:pyruvate formate lyase activating enzyme